MFLAVLSKQDIRISRYEIVCIGSLKKSTLVDGNIILFDKLLPFHRLAFTKSVYKVLCATAPNKLEAALNKVDLNRECKGTFAARIQRSDESLALPFSEEHFAILLWHHLSHPKVDLEHPGTTFVLFITKKRWYVCTHVWTNTERFEDRRNHLLPEPHPTGLHPRLARSLVNILGTKCFLDPFCGAGGLLIEGALCGCRVSGSDVDRIQVNRARINLAHFGFTKVPLKVRDALTIRKKTAGIITDLPYGKNSILADMQRTYRQFLRTSSNMTQRMVLCLPDSIDEKSLLKGTRWKKEASFTHYLHQSLSKRILVLVR
jgi:tRNA (guanine10-N2)-dimethyltransferase